jgi:uncharacterized protein YndB with AHSA1/START domain
MTVISTVTDPEDLTLTLVAEFAASPDRVWSVWEDPRLLERWWGPPGWPATFTRHDFVVGGESRYHMTGPGGERHHGYWVMSAIERPVRIDFANGLAGPDGEPMAATPPMSGGVTLEATPGGTRMTAVTRFLDVAQMDTMVKMGMPEGMTAAVGQVDALLALGAGDQVAP